MALASLPSFTEYKFVLRNVNVVFFVINGIILFSTNYLTLIQTLKFSLRHTGRFSFHSNRSVLIFMLESWGRVNLYFFVILLGFFLFTTLFGNRLGVPTTHSQDLAEEGNPESQKTSGRGFFLLKIALGCFIGKNIRGICFWGFFHFSHVFENRFCRGGGVHAWPSSGVG